MGQCCGYYPQSKQNKAMSRNSTNNLEELNKNIKLINDSSIIQSSHADDYASDDENLGSQVRGIKHKHEQQGESYGESLSRMELSRNNSDFNSKSNFTNQKPERSVSRVSKLSQSQGNCSENKTKRSFTSKKSMKTLKTYKTSKSVEHQTNNPKEQIKDILSYREVMEQLAQEAEKKKQYVIFVTNEQIIAEQEQKMKPNDEKLQYLMVGVERKQISSQGNFLSISQVQEEKKRQVQIKQQQDYTSNPECTIKTFMSFYNTVKERNDQNQSSTLDSSKNCTSGVGSGKNQQSLESQMESNLAAYQEFLTKNEFTQKELMQFAQIDSALQRIFFLLANQLKQRKQLNFEWNDEVFQLIPSENKQVSTVYWQKKEQMMHYLKFYGQLQIMIRSTILNSNLNQKEKNLRIHQHISRQGDRNIQELQCKIWDPIVLQLLETNSNLMNQFKEITKDTQHFNLLLAIKPSLFQYILHTISKQDKQTERIKSSDTINSKKSNKLQSKEKK